MLCRSSPMTEPEPVDPEDEEMADELSDEDEQKDWQNGWPPSA